MPHIEADTAKPAALGRGRNRSARAGTRKVEAPTASEPPQRRLSDKVLLAFDQACDQRNLEAAEQLVRVLETTHRRGHERATLVAAYERLWKLQHGH